MTDQVTTIAVGRIDATGRRLSSHRWRRLQRELRRAARQLGDLRAETVGAGRTTDQPRERTEGCVVLIVASAAPQLRGRVEAILRRYGLTTACYAIDDSHQPARATYGR